MHNIEEVERRIEENLRTKNTKLDLSNFGLTGNEKVLEKLKSLGHLQSLNLRKNHIIDITILQKLKKLQVLYLDGNRIADTTHIKELKNLQVLGLESNQVSDITPITELKNLQKLDLGTNQISDIRVLKELNNLQSLKLNNNNISDITVLKELKNLQGLNLSNNNISDITVLKELKKLEWLSLGNNEISDITVLKELRQLEILYLSKNKISDITVLKELKNLENLFLSDNQISDITALRELKKIKILYLYRNQISSIPLDFLNQLPRLEGLHLTGNPIKNIPKEIFEKTNVKDIKNYLQSIEREENKKELNEAKLIFVGVGEVGKTELSEALSDATYSFIQGRESTTGIRVKPWQLVDCEREEQKIDFIAHMWDFAGQEINYGTHQFFLTKNSVYVFVWETRKGEDQSKFAYWLRIVSLLSKNAPILVVQNKVDEIESEVNQKRWKEQFPNIVDFYKTSCKKNIGIDTLRDSIQKQLLELPHTREIWNKYRVAVRDELLKSSKTINYISYKEYLQICANHTVSKEDASFLSDQLHNIGSILHFSDSKRLRDTVVLNTEWVTDAAYLLLDTKKVTNGRFDYDNLDTIWNEERFDEKHEFLINLLERFELIFRLHETDFYIVPEGLPIEEPTGVTEIQPTLENKYLCFEYHYPFMPKGILSRFICRLHENIFEEYFWKYGVVLVLENETFAKVVLNDVENPKTIKIEVWGKQAEKLLAIIRSNMEHIHSKFEDLKINRKVPCNCVECKELEQPFLHDYDILIHFKEKKQKATKECAISSEDVEIISLLDGILDSNTRKQKELISLIDENRTADFFFAVKNAGMNKNDISLLRQKYVYDGGGFQFADQLKVWVMENFD